VNLAFTELQNELRAQARTFLEATPEPTWAQLAELGWTGASVAEEHGGAGLSFLEEAVIHEEAGRALLHAPLWSTSCLVPFLPAEDQAAVAAGESSWTLAVGPLVPDLDTATNVAFVGGDTIWELVGFEREVLATNDASRPLGVVSGGEPGRALCSSDALPAIRNRSLAILSLEATALGARALELAVDHVKDRIQFGRPIGSYQAVAHPLASSYTELELARSLAWWAAWCVSEDDEQAPVAAAAAGADAADAAVAACERAIQAHGGIGFTWEHVLHRLYKRALGIQAWEAPSAQLRAEVASELLDRGGT
jgi:alkylation response protein AidB-like acyl-CoA dehydrogenase